MTRIRPTAATFSEIVELGQHRHPDEFSTAIRTYRRGGLPSASMGNGSRSSDYPLPLFDRMDRLFDSAARTYMRQLTALQILRAGARAESWVLDVVADVAEQLEPVQCSNPACDRMLEGNRRSGECGTCRVQKHRASRA